MVGQRQPSFLKQDAEKCLSRLQKLKEHAEEGLISRRNFSRTKRKLLAGVVQNVNNSLQLLEAWINEFGKADQTTSSGLLGQAKTLFDTLFDSIVEAENALDSRLRRRKSRLRWFIFRNRYVSPIPAMPND